MNDDIDFLDGKMLVAMPSMGDPRFERSLIYMCAHSDDGAMGLIVNKPAHELTFPDLLKQLDIETSDRKSSPPIYVGGPVEHGRGFVLHSGDYNAEGSTMRVTDGFGMTATIDILKDIALGQGPRHALLALGYAGWGPGQLEDELRMNGWLICDADEALIFATDPAKRWDAALAQIGIDPRLLSSEGGSA